MIDVIHSVCGEVAVIYKGDDNPEWGGLAMARDYQHVDGSPVTFGEQMCCDSCGKGLITLKSGTDGGMEAD